MWDEPFVRKYLDFPVASYLSAGNMPAVAADADVRFHIFTDKASKAAFHPEIDLLAKLVDIRWHFFEDIDYGGGKLIEAIRNSSADVVKHNVQRVTAQIVLESAAADGEAAVLLDSDFTFADGAFAHMHKLRKQGKKGLAAMFLRLSQERAEHKLRHLFAGPSVGWSGVSSTELVQLGLDYPHPIAEAFFLDAAEFTEYPSQLNWRIGDAGWITHCYFPHPIMVAPTVATAKYFSSMDYECLLRAVSDDADLHFCINSEEFSYCKISSETYLADAAREGTPTIDAFASFAVNNTNIRHRLFMDQPIRYMAREDPEGLASAEIKSRAVVEAIYKAVDLALSNLSASDPNNLLYIKSFLSPIENFMSPQVRARLNQWMPKRAVRPENRG